MGQTRLERDIARAFELAIRSDRLDVADRLLGALEMLCPDSSPGSQLAAAYRAVGDGDTYPDLRCTRHPMIVGDDNAKAGIAAVGQLRSQSLRRRAGRGGRTRRCHRA